MRLLLDLQGLQGQARHRGLGRYSQAFASALAKRPEVTETVVLLSGGLGGLATAEDRARAATLVAVEPWSVRVGGRPPRRRTRP
jgi:hypothetical protein